MKILEKIVQFNIRTQVWYLGSREYTIHLVQVKKKFPVDLAPLTTPNREQMAAELCSFSLGSSAFGMTNSKLYFFFFSEVTLFQSSLRNFPLSEQSLRTNLLVLKQFLSSYLEKSTIGCQQHSFLHIKQVRTLEEAQAGLQRATPGSTCS